MFSVYTLKVLQDNFIFVLRDNTSGKTAAVDPAEAEPVLEFCRKQNWNLDFILNTHHHWDHVGGNLELKEKTGCQILGFTRDRSRIPGIDRGVEEGEVVSVGNLSARVLFIPGHTTGHIAYYFEKEKVLFSGDTLFSMGCGRLFEGTPEQMFQSLAQIAGLRNDTQVYCTHEYTLANARFAIAVSSDPSSQKKNYTTLESRLLNEGQTVPTTVGYEKEWNPFLKCKNSLEFGELRRKKDHWKDIYP